MSDDDEPGSGNGLLWYEVGRSDGYSSGKNAALRRAKDTENRGYNAGWSEAVHQINARQENDQRNGLRTIHINDFNAWMDVVNQRGQQIADLQGEVRDLEKQLENSHDSTRVEQKAKEREGLYRDSITHCYYRLLKAAEQGKTHYPEYQELKGILQQLRDADRDLWKRNVVEPLLRALNPRIYELGDALER